MQNQFEKEWQAFVEIADVVNTTGSLQHKVKTILQIVLQTIDKADAGFFFLWDEEQQHLVTKAAINFKEDYYLDNVLANGEGISGKAFKYRKAIIVNGENNIKEAMSNMQNQKRDYYLEATIVHNYPYSCMSAPIIYQQRAIGVITLDNFFTKAFFTKQDLLFLQAITNQIAVVIQMAQQLEEKQQLNHTLLQTLTHNEQLNKAMLKGMSLRQILMQLSKMVGVTILYFTQDGAFKLATQSIAYHTIEQKLQQQLHQREDVFMLQDESVIYFVYKVASHFGTIGYLVLPQIEALTLFQQILLTHSASIIAIEQINEQRSYETQLALRQQAYHSLIKGHLSHDVFGSDEIKQIQQCHHYFLFTYHLKSHNLQQLLTLEQQLQQHFQTIGTVWLFPNESGVTGLVCLKDQTDVLPTLQSLLYQDYVYVGRIVPTLSQLSLSEQDIALLQTMTHSKRFITYQELGIYRYLLQLPMEEKKYFVEETLGAILQDHKQELIDTLRAYFLYDKSVPRTAEGLHLHQNSVYYRLQKIEDTLQLRLQNTASSANLQAAIFLYDHL